MRPLSPLESYQFSLTSSEATTPAAQRAAIKREGLHGLTKAEIRKIQFSNWKALRAKNPDLPVWLLARQQKFADWRHRTPAGIECGTVRSCAALAALAHDSHNWGRLKVHGTGKATPRTAFIREEDNGKCGWDRVITHRGMDYGCVLSPCGTKLAYSVRPGQWDYTRCFRGRFFAYGSAMKVDTARSDTGITLRDRQRQYARAGLKAYLTYQTDSEIAAGSGARGKRRPGTMLVLVVDLGEHGYYHAGIGTTPTTVREAAAKRRQDARRARCEAWIAAGGIVYVGLEDSIAAGNCGPGTDAAASQLRQQFGDGGAIRSDVLLSVRDDSFSRRAVYAAVIRRGLVA